MLRRVEKEKLIVNLQSAALQSNIRSSFLFVHLQTCAKFGKFGGKLLTFRYQIEFLTFFFNLTQIV